LVWGLYFKL